MGRTFGARMWRCETLHPQWEGYGYTWRRDLNAIEPEQYVHGSMEGADFLTSPLNALISRARNGEDNPSMRRRLGDALDQRDFPVLAPDANTREAVDLFEPDLVRVRRSSRTRQHVRRNRPSEERALCLVVHPGVRGDRGPSALARVVSRR